MCSPMLQVLYAQYQFAVSQASVVTQLYLNNTDQEFSFFLLFVSSGPGQAQVLMQVQW